MAKQNVPEMAFGTKKARNGLRKSVLRPAFTYFGQKVAGGTPMRIFFAKKTTCGIVKHPLTMRDKGFNVVL